MSSSISTWDADRKKEYFKEYRRKRKESFRNKGICPNCEKRAARAGNVCCPQCLEDKKLTQKFGSAGPYRHLYAEMFERQQGQCGICGDYMGRPVLDHSHKTMEVRGLLCSGCNAGLGQFKDNPEILKAALYYLENNVGIGIVLKKRSET